MKDVKLTVRTVMTDWAETEETVFEYRGQYYRRDDNDFLRYEEDDPKCTTVIKADKKSAVISRSGETKSIMKIVPGEEHTNAYRTPNLTFDITVRGTAVENLLPEGVLHLEYILATDFGEIGKREIFITLEEV